VSIFTLQLEHIAETLQANAGPVTIPHPGTGSVEGTWPPAGYTIVPFSANADFLGNGKNITLKGTIQVSTHDEFLLIFLVFYCLKSGADLFSGDLEASTCFEARLCQYHATWPSKNTEVKGVSKC
jgi:hypothetical protein